MNNYNGSVHQTIAAINGEFAVIPDGGAAVAAGDLLIISEKKRLLEFYHNKPGINTRQ
jgi:hypothetical protein